MKRAKVYIVILMIVCTGLGVAIGIAVEKRYTSRNLRKIAGSYLLKHPGAAHLPKRKTGLLPEKELKARMDNILSRIDRELGLSSEQKDQIKAVLEDAKQEIAQARDEFGTRLLRIRKKGIAGISAVLSPKQKEKLQKLLAGMKDKRGQKKSKEAKTGNPPAQSHP